MLIPSRRLAAVARAGDICHSARMSVTVTPIPGIGRLRPGDDLAACLAEASLASEVALADGDVLAVCQKVVSKCEGRIVDLRTVTASAFAVRLAALAEGKDARAVEVVLRESQRIVRMEGGRLIVETGPGWVCANAGVDESNVDDPESVVLLPVDPDRSAREIRAGLRERLGVEVAVLVTDTFGRPFREGLTDVALGVAGMEALLDLRGATDMAGRTLRHTVLAQADGLAAAAGLLMGKGAGVPAVRIRGYEYEPAPGSGRDLIRPRENDLFR